jgi:hypothetical protein
MGRSPTPLRVQRTPIAKRQRGMLRRHRYARALGPAGALIYRRWCWSRAAAYRGLNQQRIARDERTETP